MQNYKMSSNSEPSSNQQNNQHDNVPLVHYGGTSRKKRNWVKEEEMLLFNAISVDKYIEDHIIE